MLKPSFLFYISAPELPSTISSATLTPTGSSIDFCAYSRLRRIRFNPQRPTKPKYLLIYCPAICLYYSETKAIYSEDLCERADLFMATNATALECVTQTFLNGSMYSKDGVIHEFWIRGYTNVTDHHKVDYSDVTYGKGT